MPFYHGTNATLDIGERLFPGDAMGVSNHGRSEHVYMTQTHFSMSDLEDREFMSDLGITSAFQYAVYSAVTWGCWSADKTCEDETCEWTYHVDALRATIIPPCVNVYEVTPVGRVQDDSAHDAGPDACRVDEAIITRVLTERNIAEILGWM